MAIVLAYKDAKPPPARIIKKSRRESPFQKSKRIQDEYARALRGVAKEVGKIIKGYDPKDQVGADRLRSALQAYAELIKPWAANLSSRMIASVNKQDFTAWTEHSRNMSLAMRREILSVPVGEAFADLMRQNVDLITSIPLEAAERVHALVTENLYKGERAEVISEKILETENITKGRATTIARTEIARAASTLTQARAIGVGSTGYIWRTSKDLIVRESHRKMEGRFVKWDTPPTLIDGTTTHAGQIYNCRCWPEPEIPEMK